MIIKGTRVLASKKMDNAARGIVHLAIITLLLCIAAASASGQQKGADTELQALIEKINSNTEPDSAKYIAMIDRAMEIAKREQNNDAIATCYYRHISFVVDADKMEYSQQKLQRFEAFVERTGVGKDKFYDAWMNVITTYIDANKNISATIELKRMLNHATQHKDYYGMANAYTMFGLIHDSHETSMKNLNIALKYMKKVGKPADIAYIYYTMAINSLENDKLDEAISHAAKIMELTAKDGFENTKYYTRLADNICLTVYIKKNDKAKATEYYQKLKKMVDEKQLDRAGALYIAENIALYLCKFDDPEKMWPYYEILEYDDAPSIQLGVLMEYYRAKGEYKKALETCEKYDSLSTVEMKDRQKNDFLDANAQYNNLTLEAHNQQLSLDNAKKASQIEFAIIIILIVSGVGSALVIFVLKRKNKQLRIERDKAEQAYMVAENERSIAEQARKNEEAARKVAENMNQMKTSFIHNMSHEIRTPLNAIVGFNDLLCDDDIGIEANERKEIFAIMRKKTDQLLKLSSQVMTISRIDGNDLSPELTELPLCTICEKAREKTVENLAAGVEIKTGYQDIKQTVTTDLPLISQVLEELLDNAAKYTKQGHIILSSRKRDDGKTEIAVADTGIGIAPENATLAFERFEKLGSYEQGFGLGLSICRGIMEKLGGTIAIDTNYTEGTRVVVVIP